ncbi:hypothetical protein PV327_007066 [Microctonus hyperodae]|uniref:Leucine-rich repeat protein n=1 Tax=Microctonus hyperodae TaxID=165561 RepID=A0AA39F5K7_MICHY|nr:hypothetical protein PV327_007066 [Microctonus hyperodae]
MDKRKRRSSRGKKERISKLNDNFITVFEERCKKLNLSTPKFIVYGKIDGRTKLSSISNKCNHVIEINLQCDGGHVEKPLKLECRGYKLSVLILDTIFFTINKFRTITTLNLSNCRIKSDEIVKLATSITETGCINDVNLDMNPNARGNHYLLCSRGCKLRYLSIKFCNLGDLGVKKIADELKYQDNIQNLPTLIAINLMHNQITDNGAIYIAKQMLHTNRSIQSLNLSGNLITDTGALSILSELYIFPLTHEEIVELRKRKYVRLMKQEEKLEAICTLIQDIVEGKQKEMMNNRSMTKEKMNDSSENESFEGEIQEDIPTSLISEKETCEQLMNDLLLDLVEIDLHPFTTESYPIKGAMMSTGNLQLQHLNLSYNHLTVDTLKQMIKCIYYHSYMMLNDISRGLLHVSLEGNDIAEDDELWMVFHRLLNDRQVNNKMDEVEKLKSVVPVESEILRRQITLQSIKK